MEDEGIFYFFEHGDSGETMVIADDASIHAAIAGDAAVHYHLGDGQIPDEHVGDLRDGQAVVPGWELVIRLEMTFLKSYCRIFVIPEFLTQSLNEYGARLIVYVGLRKYWQ